MKQALFPRNTVALLLTATLLGLAGCSKAGASTPVSVENTPAQSRASLPAQSTLPTQTTPDAPAASTETPDDGGLAEVRKTALEAAPDATFVVAYLEGANLYDIGYSSIENPTILSHGFIGEIDGTHRVDVSDGTREPEVYCIFPLDPNTGMAVSRMEPETGRPGEEVYRAATGKPILLCCNGESTPNARVSALAGGQTEEFLPMTDIYWGERHISQQNGLNYYDFTSYASWEEEPAPAIPPAGPGDEHYETCQTVLNWYEATTGYRPEFAQVDRQEGDELIIRLYDDMGSHILTDGWFSINPDTLQGSNYVTEEKVDFSGY